VVRDTTGGNVPLGPPPPLMGSRAPGEGEGSAEAVGEGGEEARGAQAAPGGPDLASHHRSPSRPPNRNTCPLQAHGPYRRTPLPAGRNKPPNYRPKKYGRVTYAPNRNPGIWGGM